MFLVSNRLYAGTEDGRVLVYDVTNINAPSSLGSILLPGIDVSGTNLLVASRRGGIHWVDAANPASMILTSTIATGASWAMVLMLPELFVLQAPMEMV